jgi:hypothetical protein
VTQVLKTFSGNGKNDSMDMGVGGTVASG